MSLAAIAVLGTLILLAVVAYGPALAERVRAALARPRPRRPTAPYDPGRERRAETKARELLRSVIGEDEYAMYRALGFLAVAGDSRGYAYLIYPHRPIVAYDTTTGALLNEYCVGFPDDADPALGTRLPDSDDVLAKWMALHASERQLIADANMHHPGRQLDPGQVRRDLRRLAEWRGARSVERGEATAI
jgi:hypothetical protein